MVCLGLGKRWRLVLGWIVAVLAAVSQAAGDEAISNSIGQPPIAPAASATGVAPKVTNEQAGDPGDVRKIAFEGLRLFTANQLRLQLQSDMQFQASARPSGDLDQLIETLQSRLATGYLHCGCAEAKVAARYDESTHGMRVQVQEGTQYRAGKVEVVGPHCIDATAIERDLTTVPPLRPWKLECDGVDLADASNDNEAVWKPGEPAGFDAVSLDALKARVRRSLAEQGFPRAKFDVRLAPTPGSDLAAARVEIEESPVPARADGIEIVGLKRNTREELLQFVGVTRGDAINVGLLDRVYTQLKNSCRFWKYRVAVVIADEKVDETSLVSPVGTLLRIEVEEYTEVPPLGKALADTDEVLRKTGLLLNSLEARSSNSHLVIEASGLQKISSGIKAARCTFTGDGRGSFEILSAGETKWNFDDAFLLSADSIEAYDWKAQRRFVAPMPTRTHFKFVVKPTRGENGEYTIACVLTAAASNDAEAHEKPCVVDIQPVAMLHLAHKKGGGRHRLSVQKGELKYTDSLTTLRLDAETGRLIEFRLEEPGFGKRALVVARLEQDAFDKTAGRLRADGQAFANLYDELRQRGSTFQYVMAGIEKQPSVKDSPELLAWCHLARRVEANTQFRALCDRWLALKGSPPADSTTAATARRASFVIPAELQCEDDGVDAYIDSCLLAAPLFADEMFPRGSWPWTLVREIAFLRFKDGQPDQPDGERDARMANEFRRAWSLDSGPISALVVMMTYQDLKLIESSLPEMLARRGAETISAESFLRDVRLATEGEHGLAVLCQAVAEEFGKLAAEDQKRVIDSLPATWRAPVDRFAKRRAGQPAEPVGRAMESVLVETWQSGLDKIVAAKLSSLSTEIARKPAGKTTTK